MRSPREAVAHMTTDTLYRQLDAAELHDDLDMIQAIDDELVARTIDESLASERQAAYNDLYPETPQPWWSFR